MRQSLLLTFPGSDFDVVTDRCINRGQWTSDSDFHKQTHFPELSLLMTKRQFYTCNSKNNRAEQTS